MSLDLTRPHVVTAVHQIPFSGTFVAFCTCGAEFTGADPEAVRAAGQPHREAERERVGVVDRERDEARRRRREARREQRRTGSKPDDRKK